MEKTPNSTTDPDFFNGDNKVAAAASAMASGIPADAAPHDAAAGSPDAVPPERPPADTATDLAELQEAQPIVPLPPSDGSGYVAPESQLVRARLGLAASLYAALRAKHAATASHCLRVALGSSAWGMKLELDAEQRDELEIAALLHDVGKIGVPDSILLKPARLNREEAATIDRHRQTSKQILVGCCTSENILSIVDHAFTWWDGSRSSTGVRGDLIPLGSRIIAIVDAYDAMTTDHVYRRAMSRERAIAELFACAGTQFDPMLVEQFCDLLTSDQIQLSEGLSHRWLDELSPEQTNDYWTWNTAAQGNSPSGGAQSLFYQRLTDAMLDSVVFVDTNMQIVFWNRAAERLTGLSAASVLLQRWTSQLMGLRDEHGTPLDDNNCPIHRTMTSRVQTLRRLTMQGRGGDRLSLDARVMPVIGRNGVMQGASMLLHDASSRITMEQRIETLHLKATRDPLTNVANRAEFDRAHNEYVRTHLQRGLSCALLICDIDHFKSVNDTYGHQAGDEVLISFAATLQRAAGTGDLVARYGGEEFVMLCADCDNATITQRAEKIRREVEDTPQNCLDGRPITVSFGVTEIQAGDTPETMLRRADRALLRARKAGATAWYSWELASRKISNKTAAMSSDAGSSLHPPVTCWKKR